MQPFANTAITIINERSRNPLKHKEIPATKKARDGIRTRGSWKKLVKSRRKIRCLPCVFKLSSTSSHILILTSYSHIFLSYGNLIFEAAGATIYDYRPLILLYWVYAFTLPARIFHVIMQIRKVRTHKGGLPSYDRRGNPPDERKEGKPMITYPDLIQFCTFIVALVGLCYTIFRERK